MTASVEQLSERLSQFLRSDGEPNNTARVHFIEVLLSRIDQVDGGVKEALLNKVDAALNNLAKVQDKNPVSIDDNSVSSASQLSSLTQQLFALQQSRDADAANGSFESSLLERENEVVNELTQQVSLTTVNEPVESTNTNNHTVTLSSSGAMRLFRESLGQVTIDKRVSKAINDGPQSPGPFNPQGLTIRSLAKMRDVSPQYLHRFVSYIDTLLALQQIDASSTAATKYKKRKSK